MPNVMSSETCNSLRAESFSIWASGHHWLLFQSVIYMDGDGHNTRTYHHYILPNGRVVTIKTDAHGVVTNIDNSEMQG